jgi:hypothetical protein
MNRILKAGLLGASALIGSQLNAQSAATEAAVNAREAPVTANLNNSVVSNIDAINNQNDLDAAQYALDRARYRAALANNRDQRAINADRRAVQEAAYADAMRDWRNQFYACRHGTQAACKAATPDVSDYYNR